MFACARGWHNKRNFIYTRHQFLKLVTDIHFKILLEGKNTYRYSRDRVKGQRDRRPDLMHSGIYIYKNNGNWLLGQLEKLQWGAPRHFPLWVLCARERSVRHMQHKYSAHVQSGLISWTVQGTLGELPPVALMHTEVRLSFCTYK